MIDDEARIREYAEKRGPDYTDIDLSAYLGRHPSVKARHPDDPDADTHCCDAHGDSPYKDEPYEREAELFVPDGRHVLFLYWSESPDTAVHTVWGASGEGWACRCGWRAGSDRDEDAPYGWPNMPPNGMAGSPERWASIEWMRQNVEWWDPADIDEARVHCSNHKGMFAVDDDTKAWMASRCRPGPSD